MKTGMPIIHTITYNLNATKLRPLTKPYRLLLLLLLVTACRDAPTAASIAAEPTPINGTEPANLPAVNQQEQSSSPAQYAANNSLRFEHISVDESLSQNGAY
jgi:hypothetical protein